MILAPVAHTVGATVVLIHPVLKTGKAALDLVLVFLLQPMLVFQVETNEGVGRKIGAVLPHIDALNGALHIGCNQCCIFKIGIFPIFRFIEHLVELVVAALGQHGFIRLDKQKLISKLQHDAAEKQGNHQNNQGFIPFFHKSPSKISFFLSYHRLSCPARIPSQYFPPEIDDALKMWYG